MKLGDAVAVVATPIARKLGMDCIDPATNDLRPGSGCAQRKETMNRVYDWAATKLRGKKAVEAMPEDRHDESVMLFVIQTLVEAEGVEEALEKSKKGEGQTLSVNPRPQPAPAQPRPPGAAVVRSGQPGMHAAPAQ